MPKCSVCGDKIDIISAIKLIIKGEVHYFDCEGCLHSFVVLGEICN